MLLRGSLALLLLTLSAVAHADDAAPRASLHYSELKDYQARLDGLKDLDQLTVSARIGSTQPGVKPSDITLSAKLASGKTVEIPIDAEGTLTLPSSPELTQQDPLFVSNQPKGTLQINLKFDTKTPTVTTQDYKALTLSAVQFNQAFKRQGMMASLFGPKAQGLLFAFESGTHSLTLHTRRGDQVLKSEPLADAQRRLKTMKLSDDSGKVTFLYLPLDDDLMDEDPQTVFDALPMAAIPAF